MKKLLSMLLVLVMSASFVTAAQAAETSGKSNVPELNLDYRDVDEIYTLDSENDAYIGVFSYRNYVEDWAPLVRQLNNIGKVARLESGKKQQGDLVLRMRGGKHYSYKLEANNILNIDGKRYQLSENQAQRFQTLCNTVASFEYAAAFPKWLAGIYEPDIVSGKEYWRGSAYYSSEDLDFGRAPIEDAATFIVKACNLFEITKVQRYKTGSIAFPKDVEYYEAVLTFKSGVVLKIMGYGDTLCVESNKMKYGCQYRLKPKRKDVTTVLEAYDCDWFPEGTFDNPTL